MSTRINKRVLVFVDEHGTAGQSGFAFGCVVVFGRDAGRADKVLSDNLAATAKEIHAAELGQRYVGDILRNFHASDRRETGGTPSAMYARALVRTVASGLRIFRRGSAFPASATCMS